MTTWVLIVYIGSSGLYLPLTAHATEKACNDALNEWVLSDPGSRGARAGAAQEAEAMTGGCDLSSARSRGSGQDLARCT